MAALTRAPKNFASACRRAWGRHSMRWRRRHQWARIYGSDSCWIDEVSIEMRAQNSPQGRFVPRMVMFAQARDPRFWSGADGKGGLGDQRLRPLSPASVRP